MRVLYGDGLVAVEAVPQEPAGEAVGGGAGGNGDAPQEGAEGAGAGAGGGAGGTGDTAKEAADGAPAKGGAEGARGGVANGAEGLLPCGIHAGDAPQVGALAWVGHTVPRTPGKGRRAPAPCWRRNPRSRGVLAVPP